MPVWARRASGGGGKRVDNAQAGEVLKDIAVQEHGSIPARQWTVLADSVTNDCMAWDLHQLLLKSKPQSKRFSKPLETFVRSRLDR